MCSLTSLGGRAQGGALLLNELAAEKEALVGALADETKGLAMLQAPPRPAPPHPIGAILTRPRSFGAIGMAPRASPGRGPRPRGA